MKQAQFSEHSTTYKEIVDSLVVKFRSYDTTLDYLKKRIELREKQIERLNKRQNKNYDTMPRWINEVVKPIAEMLLPEFPGRHYEILGPFGICSATAVHFYKNGVEDNERFKGSNCISITFVPGSVTEGEFFVRDYTTNTGEYRHRTIGEMNGMNHPNIPIPETAGIKWFMDFIESQRETEAVTC